jgi:hypothetical protein
VQHIVGSVHRVLQTRRERCRVVVDLVDQHAAVDRPDEPDADRPQ